MTFRLSHREFPQSLHRVVFGVALLTCGLGVSACKSDYPAASSHDRPGGQPSARQVKTARVEEIPFGESVKANGTLAAFDQTIASVKVPGRLRAISVDLGSVVRRGQVIAQVEQQDYSLRVEQSEAALAQARA
ncbi:MAG: biotin/lipoyl-binding protein, partial [Pyrinomonadaceae bacterium]